MIKSIAKTMLVVLPIFTNDLFALPAGTLDKSFSGDGLVTTPVGSSSSMAQDAIQQQDGNLVAVGSSNDGVGDRFAVARYKAADGSLDPTFGDGGIVNTIVGSDNSAAFAVVQQEDKKLVVVGRAFNSNAQQRTNDFAVVRYKDDGSLDNDFGGDGKVLTEPGSGNASSEAYAVVETADHQLVVAGFSGAINSSDFALVRYQADGSFDTDFSEDGKVTTDFGNGNDAAFSLIRDTDQNGNDRFIAAGFSKNGSSDDFAIVRYNADGALDTTFSTDGKQRTSVGAGDDHGLSVIRQTDGKYVVAGYSTTNGNEDIALVRYNEDGSLDIGFSGDGKVTTAIGSGNDRAYQVLELPDGKLLVAGYTQVGTMTDFDFVLVRYNRNGSLDATFSGDGKVSTSFGAGADQAFTVVRQTDQKDQKGLRIVLAGAAVIGSQQQFALAGYLLGDRDDDGVFDDEDNCPFVKNPRIEGEQPDIDQDMIGDACDPDIDGDGVLNKNDAFPYDPTETHDNDGDKIGDNADTDDDNDCVLDDDDPFRLDANLLNRFDGENKGDFLGFSVANAGDIIDQKGFYNDARNKDGIDDVIIGVPMYDKKVGKRTYRNAGKVTAYSGKLPGVGDPAVLRTLFMDDLRTRAGDLFGSAVAGGGDVDNDGVPDIIVGAPKADVTDVDGKMRKDAGIAVVFSGATGNPLFSIEGEAGGDNLGNAVGFAKNIDAADDDQAAADGDEIIVGAWKADRIDTSTGKTRTIKDVGAAYVYSYKGMKSTWLHKFLGENKGDLFGFSVASADIDKDGKADAIIGAYAVDALDINGKKLRDAGRVYVYSLTGGFLELFHQDGEHAGDRLGFAVAGADVFDDEDVIDDGYADVLAGAPGEDIRLTPKKIIKDAGTVHVYSGKTRNTVYVARNKEPQTGALFGNAISAGGLLPGPGGEHTFIVGAYKYDPVVQSKKQTNAGKVSLHQGSNGEELFSVDGHSKNNYFGYAVGSGKHDDDDFTDIIVGGHLDDPVAGDKQIANAGIVQLLNGEYPSPSCVPPQ